MPEGSKRFAGKTAIVTGGSRGIGRAIAIKLAAEGAAVAIASRDAETVQRTVSEIEQSQGRAFGMALDLRDPATPKRLVDATVEKFGSLDIVVNNAGATKRGDFLSLTDADFEDGFALKYYAGMRTTRAAWPHLKARKGAIVNIVGVGGRTPGAEFTIGGSVNSAILSFTKAIADLGVKDGVQVNAINPGLVQTDRFNHTIEARAEREGVDIEKAKAGLIAAAGITRVGQPEEVADLVAFIIAEGRWLQGSIIDIDGGQTKTL